jgi:hypothetical protein
MTAAKIYGYNKEYGIPYIIDRQVKISEIGNTETCGTVYHAIRI